MPPIDNGYDDEPLSDDEKKALEELNTSTALPEADDGTVTPVDPTPEPAATDPAPEPGAEPAPANDEAAELAEFAKKHAGKTPEQLIEMLHAQTKRANSEGFRARKANETLTQLSERARATLAKKKEGIAGRRAEFDKLLESDPDAAAKRIHDRLLDDEEREAEAEAEALEHNARVDAALELAAQAIPDFKQAMAPTLNFGIEMGYSREEIGAIADGRDIITLYLASKFAELVKGGIVDVRGSFLKAPQPVNDVPQDPRLKTPAAVTTLSSAPARSAGAGKTAEQQLADMLNMSDEDFDKLEESVLTGLLGG